jgi:2-aminoadipate transaminase
VAITLGSNIGIIEFSRFMDYKTRMTFQTTQIQVPETFIDLGRGDPGLDLLPLDLLHAAAQDRLSQGENAFLQYGFEQGDGYFRQTLSRFLSAKYDFEVDMDTLLVTAGISGTLDLLCTLFTQPGDVIFAEEPSYFLALKIFADHGLRVVPIQTDQDGLVIDDLQQSLKEHRPKFIYVIPTFQNPAGQTLSQERREKLVDLAQEHDFLVLADEVYQFLSYTQAPPKPFGAYVNSGHVISLNTFSKILAPGLRLGWVQSHPTIIERIISCGMLDSGGGLNPFSSAIVRSLIESGGLDQNIRKLVEVYAERVSAMDQLLRLHLPGVEFTRPQGGYFFWMQLPGIDAGELRKKAQAHEVGLRQGNLFSSRNALTDYIRLSISFYDVKQIEEGIARLGKCLQEAW